MPSNPLPTPRQKDAVRLVEVDVFELVAELQRDGHSMPVILTGFAMAITQLLISTGSRAGAARWFAGQARVITELGKLDGSAG